MEALADEAISLGEQASLLLVARLLRGGHVLIVELARFMVDLLAKETQLLLKSEIAHGLANLCAFFSAHFAAFRARYSMVERRTSSLTLAHTFSYLAFAAAIRSSRISSFILRSLIV